MTTGAGEPIVGVLAEKWGAIATLAEEMVEAEWDRPSECPGWAVRDLVAHMIGTERQLLGDPDPPPLADVPGYVANAVGARNEAWVVSRRPLPVGAVLDEFREVTARRLADMQSWPPARFDEIGPSPVGNVEYREFMRVRVID